MKNQAKWLSEFYAEVAKGGKVEFLPSGIEGCVWNNTDNGPNLKSIPGNWRIAPTLKPVDLSVLIELGIDCEFSTHTRFGKGKQEIIIASLIEIKEGRFYSDKGIDSPCCRPRLDHWHSCGNIPNHHAEPACRMLMVAGFNAYYSTEYNAVNIQSAEPLIDGYCMPWLVPQ